MIFASFARLWHVFPFSHSHFNLPQQVHDLLRRILLSACHHQLLFRFYRFSTDTKKGGTFQNLTARNNIATKVKDELIFQFMRTTNLPYAQHPDAESEQIKSYQMYPATDTFNDQFDLCSNQEKHCIIFKPIPSRMNRVFNVITREFTPGS
jgi:hypothetical protein